MDMSLRTTLEDILFSGGHRCAVDSDYHLKHRHTVLEAGTTTPEGETAFGNGCYISGYARFLETLEERNRRCVNEQLDLLGADCSGRK